MAAPTITALPTPPSRSSPSTFNADAEAHVAALTTLVTEINAFGTWLGTNSTIIGSALDATTMGLTTPAAGSFTNLKSSANTPDIEIEELDGALDEKRIRTRMVSGQLRQQLVSDDGATSNTIFTVNRVAEVLDYFQWNDDAGSAAMRLDGDGNLILNGTTVGTSSVGTLTLFNGTAPTGSVTNGVIVYSQDLSASAELYVRDEAGNETLLSPHNFSGIPDGPSEDMAWAFLSNRNGKRLNVDMMRAMRLIEGLTGEQLVHISEAA